MSTHNNDECSDFYCVTSEREIDCGMFWCITKLFEISCFLLVGLWWSIFKSFILDCICPFFLIKYNCSFYSSVLSLCSISFLTHGSEAKHFGGNNDCITGSVLSLDVLSAPVKRENSIVQWKDVSLQRENEYHVEASVLVVIVRI